MRHPERGAVTLSTDDFAGSPHTRAVRFELALDAHVRDGFTLMSPAWKPGPTSSSHFPAARAAGAWLQGRDDHAAEVIEAEAQRLFLDDAPSRAREKALLADAGPHAPRYRPQFYLGHYMREPATIMEHEGTAAAWIFDDDAVSLADSVAWSVNAAEVGFEPMDEPWRLNVEARHALRELLTGEVAQRLVSLRLLLFGDVAPYEALLGEAGRLDVLTHLTLRTQQEDLDFRGLASRLPNLRGLSLGAEQVHAVLSAGCGTLESLRVEYGAAQLESVLALLEPQRLPLLSHLGLTYGALPRARLEAIARHPLIENLMTLDLFTVNDAQHFDFTALRDLRPQLEHLRMIAVPAHLVWEREADFVDWPAVVFVNHDRRELMALDLETTGWTREMR